MTANGKITSKKTNFRFNNLSNRIDDMAATFETDALIRKLVTRNNGAMVRTRWSGKADDAVSYGRKVLELAKLEAEAAAKIDLRIDTKRMTRTRDLAEKTKKMLSQLVKHIAGILLPVDGTQEFRQNTKSFQIQLSEGLRHIRARSIQSVAERQNNSEVVSKSQLDAKSLCDALQVADWLAIQSENLRSAVTATLQNPGVPEKLAFVKTLIKGWIFLTGNKPGRGNDAFAIFVTTAWGDVCAQETDWTHAIGKASRSFSVQDVRKMAEQSAI